jgi:hypothetical protein
MADDDDAPVAKGADEAAIAQAVKARAAKVNDLVGRGQLKQVTLV